MPYNTKLSDYQGPDLPFFTFIYLYKNEISHELIKGFVLTLCNPINFNENET